MTVKLLTEHHLEFLSFKGGYTGSSQSSLVKIPHCWKSHVAAHMNNNFYEHISQTRSQENEETQKTVDAYKLRMI